MADSTVTPIHTSAPDASSGKPGAVIEANSLYTGETPFLVKYPWVGYLLFVLGGLGFVLIAWQVKTAGPLTRWDMPFATWMDGWARSQSFGLILLMKALSLFGRDGVGLILIVLLVIWVRHSMHRELGWLLLGVPIGELLYQVAGGFVNRPRPPFKTFEEILGYGFPSGHAATNILLVWLILALLFPRIRSKARRTFWSVVALVVLFGVLFSRLFLGLHYLTDMAAGMLLGLSWGGLVYTSLELYAWRRRMQGQTS
jgi:undecaprenyl-diphosphatase